ncbi:hypothetical protein WMF20_16455 [Sorangium sp. So ce834]|uniref:hypothetical protein n=1 Tax=Sorangium sp. So ce834 TaxID=3133321 RepID=UPI003F631F24
MFFGSRSPHAFSALERRFEPGERIFTSMDRRAIDHDRTMPIPDTDQALKRALLAFARELYSRLRLRSLIRIDLRADEHGRLYVLEADRLLDQGAAIAVKGVGALLVRRERQDGAPLLTREPGLEQPHRRGSWLPGRPTPSCAVRLVMEEQLAGDRVIGRALRDVPRPEPLAAPFRLKAKIAADLAYLALVRGVEGQLPARDGRRFQIRWRS